MTKQLSRLGVAALLSTSMMGATFYWYYSTETKISSNSTDIALAYVTNIKDEIQRRPSARLLWQTVGNGEKLFDGEAVRTSERGEVRIQFLETDKYIDLEPESLIVIKKSAGEIALDLMEGSVFVDNSKSADTKKTANLVLNSNNGKVDLSTAKASLSKNKGSQVSVQVLEGTASVKSSTGETKELTKGVTAELTQNGFQFEQNSLKILTPDVSKPIYVNPLEPKPTAFKWDGFPEKSDISLWMGNTRKSLKEVAKKNEQGLSKNLTPGTYYWKLVAKDPQTQKVVGESRVYRSQVNARFPTSMIYPVADTDIKTTHVPLDLTFKWQKPAGLKQLQLELWSDPQLKTKVLSQGFTVEDSYTLNQMTAGDYYWRITTFYDDTDEPMVGKIQRFRITQKDDQIIPIIVNWNLKDSEKSQFFIDNPSLLLKWTADKTDKVANWKVVYQNIEDKDAGPIEQSVKALQYQTTVTKPGRYIASVEALDDKGRSLGRSENAEISIAPLPLILSPKIIGTEAQLTAGEDGKINLNWEKIEGAKEYQLKITKDGKEKLITSKSTGTKLSNLFPGEYKLELEAVDTHGRKSDGKDTRTLIVPNSSGLKAPKLNKIKVN